MWTILGTIKSSFKARRNLALENLALRIRSGSSPARLDTGVLASGPGTAACGWFSAVTGMRGEVPWRSSNPQRYFDGTGRASAASGLARAEFAAMAALLSIARSSA